jgi:NAD(P)-dependent dehydrogenase (short-subunit alcohol dehydrogenase family)
MYPELSGKVAVISGAGGNLGRAVARRLHAENVQLALIDINEPALERFVRDQGWPQETVLIGEVDLTRKDEVDRYIERATATFEAIDILVNVAGGFKMGLSYAMDESDWDFLMNLNARSAFLLSTAVVRTMLEKGRQGRIINIAARAALAGSAGLSAYSASKAAVLRLTESLAAELQEHGITVNAVLPSTLDTPQNRQAMPNADFSKWVTPESLADVIAFLASEGARDISGAGIPVYGRA